MTLWPLPGKEMDAGCIKEPARKSLNGHECS